MSFLENLGTPMQCCNKFISHPLQMLRFYEVLDFQYYWTPVGQTVEIFIDL